jgi:hypothetical protein
MSNYQVGYGHGDVVGVPFDFYAGATLVTGSTITMQTAVLVLNPTGTLATLTVNLPLNPVDGADASITSTQAISAAGLTVNANTGDAIANGVLTAATSLTPAATATAGSATATIKYKYTLNGFQPASGAAVNPRTWIRVQ